MHLGMVLQQSRGGSIILVAKHPLSENIHMLSHPLSRLIVHMDTEIEAELIS